MSNSKNALIMMICMNVLALLSCKSTPSDPGDPAVHTLNVRGEYLGQPSPGDELVRFAATIIPADLHGSVTVSPDGREIYWASRRAIYFTRMTDDSLWTVPEIAPFSSTHMQDYYDDIPFVSPDNMKLFFNSRRPIASISSNKENIWYCSRTNSGWSSPQPLPQTINSMEAIHWQVSVSNSGTLFFGAYQNGMKIFFSRFVEGEYATPEPLIAINEMGNVFCPFIAPDESYLIFAKEVNGIGNLFISFKTPDAQWSQPQTFNQLTHYESSFATRDGKYFFTQANWMSARLIEEMKPE